MNPLKHLQLATRSHQAPSKRDVATSRFLVLTKRSAASGNENGYLNTEKYSRGCDSFISRKYKINLVSTLAYRCFRICSSPRLLQLALDDLKRILLLNVKHQNKPKDPVQKVKREEVLIVLPFLGYHSKHLRKQPRSYKQILWYFQCQTSFSEHPRNQVLFPLQR